MTRRRRFDERITLELPTAQRVIPLGIEERRHDERSAFKNLKVWLLEVVDGEGSDTDKVNAVKMILESINKEQLTE